MRLGETENGYSLLSGKTLTKMKFCRSAKPPPGGSSICVHISTLGLGRRWRWIRPRTAC